MNCNECGYVHSPKSEKNWLCTKEGYYQITSNIFNEQILKEIVEHQLSINPRQNQIVIDTCHIDLLTCSSCFQQNLRNQRKRAEVERKYFNDFGLSINYCF